MSSPLELLLIQPTRFCNIDCKYCYLPRRNERDTFDLDFLEPLFAKLWGAGLLGENLTVLWHAGEPLAASANFYESAFRRIATISAGKTTVTHNIQTNGMLLTQQMCELIKRYSVQIGISIDGPAIIHNANRKSRAGTGTFDKTIAGISLLQLNNIPFSAIAVVSATTLNYPSEFFDFFQALGATAIGLNIEEVEGHHKLSSLDVNEVEQQYRKFLSYIYKRALKEGGVTIRELANFTNNITSYWNSSELRSSESNPFSILSVDVDGNLYTFSPELVDLPHLDGGNYSFGHVNTIDFAIIYQQERFRNMCDDISRGIEACKRECGYFDACGGGAPINKVSENGSFSSTETMFCRYMKQIPLEVFEDIILEEIAVRRAKMRPPLNSRFCQSIPQE